MPPDVFEDNPGGMLNWDSNTLLPNPTHEHWYPTPSAAGGNLIIHNANYDLQPQYISASPVNPHLDTAPSRGDDAFTNGQAHKYEFDVHQGQHWSDLPSQQHALPAPATAILSGAAVGTRQFPQDESPHGSVGSVAKVQSQPILRKGPVRESTKKSTSAATSPSKSVTSAPKAHGLESTKAQRVSRQPREVPPSKSLPNNGSGYMSPNRAQAGFDRKKNPALPKSTALNRVFSVDVAEAREEDDLRSNQFGSSAGGGSTVSSVSGQSRGENHLSRPDGQDDEVTSTLSRSERKGTGTTPGVLRNRSGYELEDGQRALPHAKGFSIQIGSEVFKLSGASIMSDAPSYFSRFFEEQLQHDDGSGTLRTLYIDRDPSTFQDICRHLQGYYIQPRDGAHFVRLFADAQFYSLPRLISQLFESEIFVQIGGENFQIPRDIFSNPGNSPNFFSLGFAVFFSTPGDVFPGLDSGGLLRPPSVHPPCVPNRSAKVFSELLHLLRGYSLHIRDRDHRAELLRDCRYFNLRGLEQKLIVHDISYNAERGVSEIIIRLEDIRQSGVSFVGDASPSERSPLSGWVYYSRPFVDETSYEIIVEIGDESTRIDFRHMRADFYNDAKARIASLFQVVANKMNLPTNAPLGLMMSSGGAASQAVSPGNTPLSEDRVKIRIDRDAHITLDGKEYITDGFGMDNDPDVEYSDFSPGPTRIRPPPMSSTSSPGSALQPSSPWPPIPMPPHQRQQRQPRPVNFPPYYLNPASETKSPPRKRQRRGSLDEFGEWMIRKGQWRMRVQPRPEGGSNFGPGGGMGVGVGGGGGGGGGLLGEGGGPGSEGSGMEIVLCAVKLDAISGQKGRNTLRGFLT